MRSLQQHLLLIPHRNSIFHYLRLGSCPSVGFIFSVYHMSFFLLMHLVRCMLWVGMWDILWMDVCIIFYQSCINHLVMCVYCKPLCCESSPNRMKNEEKKKDSCRCRKEKRNTGRKYNFIVPWNSSPFISFFLRDIMFVQFQQHFCPSGYFLPYCFHCSSLCTNQIYTTFSLTVCTRSFGVVSTNTTYLMYQTFN